ncbi:hypothetical protein WR25_27223 [Diploscapter pachys]|uniref:Uncharacterized protein n=1 Tax=Diploscapter pachys TaxID=2018661 RepID=A0A2A2JRY6_9BILA|nr:hypothetical protein WR25_27223 [Diploscapter pachys]
MPSSVPTDQAEKEYKDYVRRRQEAGFNGERMTASRFVPSRGTSSKDRPKLTGHGKYDLPSNEYKSSGFTQRSSELGEDPLTAVRTMRNNLRRLAIMHKNGDRPVKAHLCESACDELTKKEEEIAKLGQQRSTAIMMGNTKEAERLTGKMNEVKESALQGSYADLIVEGDQMKAFGVDSKWTPHGEGFLGDDTRPMNDQGNTLAAAPRHTFVK